MSSLYFHIPFCQHKCPYCDFFSTDAHSPAQREAYVDLLLRHMQLTDPAPWQGPLQSVFFGGGTPSLLTPQQVSRLLRQAETRFGFVDDIEISLEANPGTVTGESLTGYRAAGINRLSLGIQTLHAEHLRQLGRIHTPTEALSALRQARQAGFSNLSCDLMFALPWQRLEDLTDELLQLLDMQPEHLSCYGLTIEEETPFHARHTGGQLRLPEEAAYVEHYLALDQQLTAAGFEHYEISNYARPGYQCRHNLGYWRRQTSLGLGAGAHSFDAGGFGRRLAVAPDLERYRRFLEQGNDPAEELERFDRHGAMAETLYLGLRTAEGISDNAFRTRFGIGISDAFAPLPPTVGRHLHQRHGRWHFDLEGWLIYDHLIQHFL